MRTRRETILLSQRRDRSDRLNRSSHQNRSNDFDLLGGYHLFRTTITLLIVTSMRTRREVIVLSQRSDRLDRFYSQNRSSDYDLFS
jgi:hypothetical protein